MENETENEVKIQTRVGSVVKECHLLFPLSLGGDIIVQPGDFVVITVTDRDSLKKLKK